MAHHDYRDYRIKAKAKGYDGPLPEHQEIDGGVIVVGTQGCYVGANVMPGAWSFPSVYNAKEAIDILIEAGANQTTGCDTQEEFEHQRTVGGRFFELFVHVQALKEDYIRTEIKKGFTKGDKVRPRQDIPLPGPGNDLLRPEYEYTIAEIEPAEPLPNITIEERPNMAFLSGNLFAKVIRI